MLWANGDEAANVAGLAAKLNALVSETKGLSGIIIDADEGRKADLEKIAADKLAVAYIPAGKKADTLKSFKISAAKNVVILYKGKKAVAAFENVAEKDFDKVAAAAKAM